nr:Ig-like domain-containing protein [Brevibacillus fulvus]
MATFEDGTVEDVAAKAEWSTNKDDVADVVKGLITAYGTGEATITATYGGKTATITVQVDIAKRLEVDKPSLIMQINQSEDVALTAYYADGTSEIVTNKAKWSSSNPDVVDVDSTGKVSSYAVGQATLTASYGTKEVTISVDVGTGKKLEIDKQDLFLHKGESEQLTLTATFADGSTDDVTSEATWTSSDEDVAYVAKGKVSAFGSGEATITATYGDKSVKVSVDVDIPRNLEVNKQDISLQVGDSEQLVLTAAYADGSTDDVTSEADWSSSNEDVAYVKNGKISAYEAGSTVITATYQGKKVTIVVDVDVPRKLEVSDSSLILQDDGSAAVTVYAVYADNRKEDVTKEAEWKSSNEDVAEVSDGVVDGTGIGTATITVTYLNRSATISVQVGVIKDLSASDTRVALDETGSKQVTLTATFGDGTTKDVTEEAEWVSAAEDVASVLDGLIKAKASGKTNVTATYKNKSITIPVEVGVAKTLTADVTKLVMGLTDQKQIKLTATFTQGSVKDVTEEAEWFSGNTKVVSVTSGAVTANGTGKTTITAKYGGATLVIPVEIEVVQKLELNKRYLMMKTGQTEQLVATAVYSNGTTRDVSSEADWTTRNYKIADVVDGLVTATGSGKTTLSVKYGGKTLTIPIENDNLKYLKASAVKLEMKTGEKKQVTLTATYMDNSEANVTVPAIWATSKILVADAKDGIIQANGPGQAMITATYAGKRVTIVVIVRP